jgi:hypothetical protein
MKDLGKNRRPRQRKLVTGTARWIEKPSGPSLWGRLSINANGKTTEYDFRAFTKGKYENKKVTVHGSNSMKSRGFCKAEGRFEPQNAHLRSRTP